MTAALEEADRLLVRFGINDRLRIKFRKTSNRDWLGQYRGFSQFRSGPIFWINEQAHPTPDQIIDTILHEYGHVIWEWARLRDARLFDMVKEISSDDEEDFAETFSVVVKNNAASPAYREVVAMYIRGTS